MHVIANVLLHPMTSSVMLVCAALIEPIPRNRKTCNVPESLMSSLYVDVLYIIEFKLACVSYNYRKGCVLRSAA